VSKSNKRKHKRLRVDRSVKIPIHLFPKMPFIGQPVSAFLLNLSAGGMALSVDCESLERPIPRGTDLKIHFRLPGRPLQECRGRVTHSFKSQSDHIMLGIKFEKCPDHLMEELEAMSADNEACDYRIEQTRDPWCVPTCSFFDLCRKPIRPATAAMPTLERLEIALQARE
jgi:hypothetical protein